VTKTLTALVAIGLIAPGVAALAQDGAADRVTVSGFGTVAAEYSTERQADFSGSLIQPNGVGHTAEFAGGPDSRFGLQGRADFGERLSSVVQLVAQHQYDNEYAPQIEWANVKFKLRPDLSVRLGRTELPVFMLSDSRLVGYANLTLRPPVEVYSSDPMTSNDGVDLTWRVDFDDAVGTLQALAGRSRARFPEDLQVTASRTRGLNFAYESGALTLRLHYTSTRVDLRSGSIDSLLQGYRQLGAALATLPGLQGAAARATALAKTYDPTDVGISFLTVGIAYDPGAWVITAEWAADVNPTVFFDRKAWYTTIGRRFGNWTPYVTRAEIRSGRRTESDVSSALLATPLASSAAALDAGLNRFLATLAPTQRSVSLGVRWDLARHFDLKLQYDRVMLGAGSAGTLVNTQPTFRPGGKLGVFGLGLDFVF
jgi:hypothetical protein